MRSQQPVTIETADERVLHSVPGLERKTEDAFRRAMRDAASGLKPDLQWDSMPGSATQFYDESLRLLHSLELIVSRVTAEADRQWGGFSVALFGCDTRRSRGLPLG